MTDLSASIIAHPAARPQARPAAPPSLHFAGLLWSPIDFGLLLLLVLEFCQFMVVYLFSFLFFHGPSFLHGPYDWAGAWILRVVSASDRKYPKKK
jgi:hypothetical protein